MTLVTWVAGPRVKTTEDHYRPSRRFSDRLSRSRRSPMVLTLLALATLRAKVLVLARAAESAEGRL